MTANFGSCGSNICPCGGMFVTLKFIFNNLQKFPHMRPAMDTFNGSRDWFRSVALARSLKHNDTKLFCNGDSTHNIYGSCHCSFTCAPPTAKDRMGPPNVTMKCPQRAGQPQPSVKHSLPHPLWQPPLACPSLLVPPGWQ